MIARLAIALLPLLTWSAPAEQQVLRRDGVTLEFDARTPPDKAQLILAEALRARAAVAKYLGMAPIDVTVRVNDTGVPFTNGSVIDVPASRMGRFDPSWKNDPFALVHEITHAFKVGGRGDRMLTEGLAVHVHDLFGGKTYPNFGANLHDLTIGLERKRGAAIPLLASEQHRLRGTGEYDRQLAYVQEGSFSRWYVDTRGLAAFLKLVDGGPPGAEDAAAWGGLEREWRAMLAGRAAAG